MDSFIATYNRVLIINNSALDIFLLREKLVSINYASQISTSVDPVKTFEFLKKCTDLPELIFIDYKMPEITGFQFIENYQKKFSFPTKFILLISPDDKLDFDKSLVNPSILQYIKKPVSNSDFIQQLNKAS